jgi:hypothetical protein
MARIELWLVSDLDQHDGLGQNLSGEGPGGTPRRKID